MEGCFAVGELFLKAVDWQKNGLAWSGCSGDMERFWLYLWCRWGKSGFDVVFGQVLEGAVGW